MLAAMSPAHLPSDLPPPLLYTPYHELAGRPNVVVDGSPTAGTVLTLTHWPGYQAPAGLEADLSAQMAFLYLEQGRQLHADAQLVSNNHFDQDGLAGLLALAHPVRAVPRRRLLEDLAAAGDFAVYTDRNAARVSMAVAAFADQDRSPLRLETGSMARTAQLYEELLELLPELCDHPEHFRTLWEEEDAGLTRSEELIESGKVTVVERPDLDLAVVDVPEGEELAGGHRFPHQWEPGLHPMAIRNATDRTALLVRQGRHYRLTYRYEGWVQLRSRPVRARRDLGPLAAALTAEERGNGVWVYDGSADLEPAVHLNGEESDMSPERFLDLVVTHLESAPADWDPYRPKESFLPAENRFS